MDLFEKVLAEWRVIAQAPVTFIILAVVMFVAAYSASSWFYSGKVSSLEERLKLRDDRAADYERKLQGASPDQAKARLDELEAAVRAVTPRRLNDEQRQRLTTALSSEAAFVEIALDMGASEAKQFSGDLVNAFSMAGWRVSTPSLLGAPQHPPTGLALLVADPSVLSPAERRVAQALQGAGVAYDIAKADREPESPGRPAPNAVLLVTTRLN